MSRYCLLMNLSIFCSLEVRGGVGRCVGQGRLTVFKYFNFSSLDAYPRDNHYCLYPHHPRAYQADQIPRPKYISRDLELKSLSNSRLSEMVFCLKYRVCLPLPQAGKLHVLVGSLLVQTSDIGICRFRSTCMRSSSLKRIPHFWKNTCILIIKITYFLDSRFARGSQRWSKVREPSLGNTGPVLGQASMELPADHGTGHAVCRSSALPPSQVHPHIAFHIQH